MDISSIPTGRTGGMLGVTSLHPVARARAQTIAPCQPRRSGRPPPPLPSRTKWTRLVHPSVLTGHVSSIPPYARRAARWRRLAHQAREDLSACTRTPRLRRARAPPWARHLAASGPRLLRPPPSPPPPPPPRDAASVSGCSPFVRSSTTRSPRAAAPPHSAPCDRQGLSAGAPAWAWALDFAPPLLSY